jgi:hypothetical protein
MLTSDAASVSVGFSNFLGAQNNKHLILVCFVPQIQNSYVLKNVYVSHAHR